MAEDLVMKLGIEGIDDVTKQVESLAKGTEKSFAKIGDAVKGAGASLDKITEALGGAADTAAKFGEPGEKFAAALTSINEAAGPLKQGLAAVDGAMGNMKQAFAAFAEGAAGIKGALVNLKTEAAAAANSLKGFAAAEGIAAKTAVLTTAVTRLSTAVNGLMSAFVPYLGALIKLEAAYEILRPLFGGMTEGLSTSQQMMRDLEVATLKAALALDKLFQAFANWTGIPALIEQANKAVAVHTKELAEVREQYKGTGQAGKEAGDAVAAAMAKAKDETAALGDEADKTRGKLLELKDLPEIKTPKGIIDYDTSRPRTYGPNEDIAGVRRSYSLQHGGQIHGPGTSTSDSIPAYLSAGEYVVNARAVSHYGVSTLHALNRMRLAFGGLVGYAGGGSVCDWQKIEDLFTVRLRLQKQAKSALYADEAAAIYKQADQITKQLHDARKACGYAAGGFVGLDRPIGFASGASGGCVGCANMTERRFTAPGFQGGGLSSIATNIGGAGGGGGGLNRGGNTVHLHMDNKSFQLSASDAVLGALERHAGVRRMTSAGRRSSSEG
jgi:hypothetical protein